MARIDEFIIEIKEQLTGLCGKDCKVKILAVKKNNGTIKYGAVFTVLGKESRPAVYLDPYYRLYQEGCSIEEVASAVCRQYREYDFSLDKLGAWMLDREWAKGRVTYHLINLEKNREALKDMPYREVCSGLAVVYALALETKGMGAWMRIRNQHSKLWELTEQELWELAVRNTSKLFPAKLSGLQEIVTELLEEEQQGKEEVRVAYPDKERDGKGPLCNKDEKEESYLDGQINLKSGEMQYILTNAEWAYGAAAILYPGILEYVSGQLEGDLFIIPSSIHETLLLKNDGMIKAQELEKILREVNQEKVAPEDVLSDSLYGYSRFDGKIYCCKL